LIRSLTDLVDAAVVASGGLIGKHAGDGASALFVVDGAEAESAAACGAIDAARRIREGASSLLNDASDVAVNVGLHWGATLTIGQVSSYGRLEVTALGDEMNEAARIEAVATNGRILASKDLLERLAPEDADALELDLAQMHFNAVSSLGADAKVLRDAGQVAVAEI
jgi:class 3 adenylate cyclase